MFQKHSLANRLVVTKTIGFVIGGAIFFLLPALGADYGIKFGLGLWLFYILMAVTIGFMGIFKWHPVIPMPLPWWVRGAAIGFSYHLTLVLLAYDTIAALMALPAFAWTGFASPFWILIDGTILGIIIAGIVTKYVGEGNLPLK